MYVLQLCVVHIHEFKNLRQLLSLVLNHFTCYFILLQPLLFVRSLSANLHHKSKPPNQKYKDCQYSWGSRTHYPAFPGVDSLRFDQDWEGRCKCNVLMQQTVRVPRRLRCTRASNHWRSCTKGILMTEIVWGIAKETISGMGVRNVRAFQQWSFSYFLRIRWNTISYSATLSMLLKHHKAFLA